MPRPSWYIIRMGENVVYEGDNLDGAYETMGPSGRPDRSNIYNLTGIILDSPDRMRVISQRFTRGMGNLSAYPRRILSVHLGDLESALDGVKQTAK